MKKTDEQNEHNVFVNLPVIYLRTELEEEAIDDEVIDSIIERLSEYMAIKENEKGQANT